MFFIDAGNPCLIHRAARRIGRHGPLALRHLFHHLTVGKVFEDFLGAHAQRAQWLEAGFHVFVSDFFGMQLQIDPVVDARGHHLLHIAGTGPEGEAIQGVHRALLFVRSCVDGLVLLPGEQLRDGACKAETQE